MPKLWRNGIGPIVVLLGVAVSEQLVHAIPQIPEPAPLVLVSVIIAGFLAPLNSAVLSSTIGIAYAILFVQPRHISDYSPLPLSLDAVFLAVWAPILAIVGSLIRSNADRNAETLRKHLTNTPLGVIELSANYEVRQWAGAAEAIFGISQADALGKSIFSLPGVFFGGDDGKRAKQLLERIERGTQTRAVLQTEREDADGKHGHSRWFWSSALEGRNQTHYLVLVEDITERVLAEQALIRSKAEIIERLVRAAERRDSETGDHIIRMARYAEQLAIALGMSADQTELIRSAAPMHDIGKVGIPDNILQKPGILTPEEYEVMKTHAAIGGEILRGSDHVLVRMAEKIAIAHHERWDGKGYPNGLKAFAIPIEARICAVCDVFDALTSERTYKEAWAVPDALAEMKRLAGNHLDPQIVETFVGILPVILAIREEYVKPAPEQKAA